MKIWNAYGSEHSANLVMIGHFKDSGTAEETNTIIEDLRAVFHDADVAPEGAERYTEKAREVLQRVKFHSIGPSELEQFRYDFRNSVDGTTVVITTDESEISGIMKLFIEKRARVEVYSAHDYQDTEHGRGKD